MPAPDPATDGAAELDGAPRERKQYTTFVAEREIAAPRSVAFAATCDLIAEATGGPVVAGDPEPHGLGARFEFSVGDPTYGRLNLSEEVISFEPPWRRVYELSGAPVALYQGTTAFTDRGETCLMAWSVVVNPLPDGASEGFLALVQPFLDNFADQVRTRAEVNHSTN
ncbi:MAG: hypothetical protein CL466_03570 [Acidimicrobiaceae bacterium]|nr:hypothetical protein [Acidimicrobiaceae bacterium]